MTKVRHKIAIVATVPFALRVFMRPHIEMLAQDNDVTLITNGSACDIQELLSEHVVSLHVEFIRQISLTDDVRALITLYRVFKKNRFDVVHSLMPKTGLLSMLAASLAFVPHRVHIFTGQVWANRSGLSCWLLKMMDRVIALCATDVLTDSFSQREFLIGKRIVDEKKIAVLGNGSICGVDLARFQFNPQARIACRQKMNISENDFVVIFLGRVNREKGVQDLVRAFGQVHRQLPNAHLLVVGPDENEQNLDLLATAQTFASHYHRVGFTDRPEDYISCADIFCLPSYREGFGSVIIEAAAAGVPAVASRIYGLVDAIVDGETGIFHDPGNVQQIQDALILLANDPILRQTMSVRTRQRAHELFNQKLIAEAMRQFYDRLLNS